MKRANLVIVCENERKAENYALALRECGAETEELIVVAPGDAAPAAPELTALVAKASGLVLCGGPDMEPQRFGEEPLPDANLELMPELDALEFAALDGARQGLTPIWAICRGLQVLNVYLGGTLWQDLPLQLPEAGEHDVPHPRDALAHPIRTVREDHRFAARLAGDEVLVNTRHHQALKDVALELTVLAEAPDGVIEAAAAPDVDPREGWWMRGVQWHPENLVALPLQRRLWLDFVEATRVHRGGQLPRAATGA